MKNIIIILIVVLGSSLLLQFCFKKPNKNKATTPNVNVTQVMDTCTMSISVKTSLAKTYPINKRIFGINIGFAFAKELDKDSGFIHLLRDLRPNNLRFPGGTVGNFYHPDGTAYGFKLSEMIPSMGALYNLQNKRSENILNNFIRLSKMVNSGSVYCANTFYGTDDEILTVISALKKNNIPILGVELGNEISSAAYRPKLPDVQSYIKSISGVALKIKSQYPDIKLSVVASLPVVPSDKSSRASFMRGWDQALAKLPFYDAYVIHEYTTCPQCDKQSKTTETSFTENYKTIPPEKFNKIFLFKDYYQQTFPKDKKIWLTEWNIGNPNFEGTFLQGLFVYEMFLNLLDINAKYDNVYDLTNVHVISNFINNQRTKNKPLLEDGANRASVQYFAFKYLSTTLTENSSRITDNMEKNPQEGVVVKSFYDKNSKRTYLYFLNRSGKGLTLNLGDKNPKNATYTALETTQLYAALTRTAFEDKNPEMNSIPITEKKDVPVVNNSVKVGAYAFGYISYTN